MAFFEMAGLENTRTVLPQSKDVQIFTLKPNQQLSYFVQTPSWLGAVECPCHGHVLAALRQRGSEQKYPFLILFVVAVLSMSSFQVQILPTKKIHS